MEKQTLNAEPPKAAPAVPESRRKTPERPAPKSIPELEKHLEELCDMATD